MCQSNKSLTDFVTLAFPLLEEFKFLNEIESSGLRCDDSKYRASCGAADVRRHWVALEKLVEEKKLFFLLLFPSRIPHAMERSRRSSGERKPSLTKRQGHPGHSLWGQAQCTCTTTLSERTAQFIAIIVNCRVNWVSTAGTKRTWGKVSPATLS